MRSTREFALPISYRSPFQRIAPGLHTLPGQSIGRVYVLESCDGLTLVDTGVSWRSGNLLSLIRSAGHSVQEVRRVLLTHLHGGHAGGLRTLQSNADVEIITSFENARQLRGQIRCVSDGDLLTDVCGGLTVIETPGHSKGHLSFWLAEQGALFTGDTLASWGGIGLLPERMHNDAGQTKRDVERLSRLNPNVICCGHGPPVTRDATARLRAVAGGLWV